MILVSIFQLQLLYLSRGAIMQETWGKVNDKPLNKLTF